MERIFFKSDIPLKIQSYGGEGSMCTDLHSSFRIRDPKPCSQRGGLAPFPGKSLSPASVFALSLTSRSPSTPLSLSNLWGRPKLFHFMAGIKSFKCNTFGGNKKWTGYVNLNGDKSEVSESLLVWLRQGRVKDGEGKARCRQRLSKAGPTDENQHLIHSSASGRLRQVCVDD